MALANRRWRRRGRRSRKNAGATRVTKSSKRARRRRSTSPRAASKTRTNGAFATSAKALADEHFARLQDAIVERAAAQADRERDHPREEAHAGDHLVGAME